MQSADEEVLFFLFLNSFSPQQSNLSSSECACIRVTGSFVRISGGKIFLVLVFVKIAIVKSNGYQQF